MLLKKKSECILNFLRYEDAHNEKEGEETKQTKETKQQPAAKKEKVK